MAEFKMLTDEEKEAFFASRESFIATNNRKMFRETMQSLREEYGNIPQARKAFTEANPV